MQKPRKAKQEVQVDQAALDKVVEVEVDDFIESKHITEIPPIVEGLTDEPEYQ